MRFLSVPFVCLSLLLLGAGCPLPSVSPSETKPTGAAFGTTVDFDHVTQSFVFEDGLTLTLKEVRDSRCPKDVVCIWAGEVSFDFVLSGGKLTGESALTLSTMHNPSATVEPYVISAALRDAESPTPMPSATVSLAAPIGTSITDFESCVTAGYPVMESYPRQCRAGSSIYVEEVTAPEKPGAPEQSEPGSPGTGEVPPDNGTVSSPPDSGYPYEGSGFILDKTACEAAGGTFNECGSACRGAAPNTPCIMMCVMYCECTDSSQCPSGYSCGDFVGGMGVCKQ